MKVLIIKFYLIFIFIVINIPAFSQENNKTDNIKGRVLDSLKKSGLILRENQPEPDIKFSTEQALIYLRQRYHPQFWNNTNDPLRQAFGRLIYEAEHPPVDTLKKMLLSYPFDSLNISWDKFYIWEPLRLKIPVVTKPEFKIPVDSSLKTDSAKIVK